MMPGDAGLIERTIDSELVFDGALLKVHRDTVSLPHGGTGVREWIAHPGAVVVIAMLDNGKLLFERQFRYPLQRVCLEFPAGKVDANEHPLDTAKRELREETGHKAKVWRHLGVMHPCIGYSDERIEIFWASGLMFVGKELDRDEFLDVTELSLSDALLAVRDGELSDAKSITALFWADKIMSGQWSFPA